jgi:ATP-dependent HslUV protease ATP-binding subunit HslU
VDQIIKDLVDNAMHLTKTKLRARFADEVNEVVENKIVDFMCGETSGDVTRDAFLTMYRDGALDHRVIELELPEGGGEGKGMELGGGGAMTPERVVIQLEKVMSVFLFTYGRLD